MGTSDGAFYRRGTVPVRLDLPAGTTRYVEGYSASCVLLDTGAVWCAGDNSYGQLGVGGYAGFPASRATFAPTLGAADAVELWGGGTAFCLRRRSGVVSCWGLNNRGQLGLRSTVCDTRATTYCRTSPTDSPQFINARHITFGTTYAQVCAVSAAGAVLCTDQGETARTLIPSGASSVEAGSSHLCALMADGTVRCWGLGVDGQLGNGGTMSAFDTPVTVSGITTAVQIMAGNNHACARLTDGTMRCWGYNGDGALGDGTIDRRSSPVAVVGLTGVDLLARSVLASHTCARRTDGSVWCWGSNGFGQLGDGTTNNNRFSPVAMRF